MKKLSLLLFASLVISCDSPKNNLRGNSNSSASVEPTLFDHFIGTWQNKTFGNYEKWEKISEGQYAAMAFTVKGADTVIQETVKVYKEVGNWVYEVTVKNQNDGLPVKFTANSLTTNQVNFSNPAHDFPTDINYSYDGDSLLAFIAGIGKDGDKRDTIPFAFERVGGE